MTTWTEHEAAAALGWTLNRVRTLRRRVADAVVQGARIPLAFRQPAPNARVEWVADPERIDAMQEALTLWQLQQTTSLAASSAGRAPEASAIKRGSQSRRRSGQPTEGSPGSPAASTPSEKPSSGCSTSTPATRRPGRGSHRALVP